MLELRGLVTAFGFCVFCGVSGPAAAERPFHPDAYFCRAQPDELVTIEDAVAATQYFLALREGMATIDPASCSAPWFLMAERLASLSDQTEKSAFIAGMVQSQMSASVDSDTSDERYARDTHILLLAARVCALGDTDPAGCIKGAISSLPDKFTVSSPVFCDFSPDPFVPLAGQSTEVHRLPESLPFLCSPLSSSGTVESDAEEVWFSSAVIWLSLQIED